MSEYKERVRSKILDTQNREADDGDDIHGDHETDKGSCGQFRY
jgi:hypothetical protein